MKLTYAVASLILMATPCAAQQSGSASLDPAARQEIEWMTVVVKRLTTSLIDPASARISLPYGFTPKVTTWKVWGVDMTGYFTCGTVNSRNRLGGYVGETTFLAYISPQGEVNTTLDSYKTPLLGQLCARGRLPAIRPSTLAAIQSGS